MFARRNSVTLAALWLILLMVGVFLYIKDTRRLVAGMTEQVDLSKKLEASQAEIKRLKGIEDEHAELSQEWVNLEKKVVSADEPSFTLSYINWIMTTNNLIVDFDFVLNHKKDMGDYTRFSYTLTGESSYNEIMNLLWHLTHDPVLYKITELNLNKSAQDRDVVTFSIKLEGYSVSNDLEIEEFAHLSKNSISPMPVQHNIFTPLVKPKPVFVKKAEPKLPTKLPGQIDVEKATVQAVTSHSVFIREGNGKVVELNVGDAVYLGSLLRINFENSEAEFLITKFGQSKRITLGINYRK